MIKKMFNAVQPYHIGIIIPFIISTFILKPGSEDLEYKNFYVFVFSFYLVYESIFNMALWIALDHGIRTGKAFRVKYRGWIIFSSLRITPIIAKQVYLEQKISAFRSVLFLLKVLSLFVSMIIGFFHYYIVYGLSIGLYLFTYSAMYERSRAFCIKFHKYL